MSYDFPSTPNPKRRGGGGMFFLVILAIGGFLIFSNFAGQGGRAPAEGDTGVLDPPANENREFPSEDDEFAAEREKIFGNEERQSAARKKMPTTGGTGAASDWKMQDAGATQNPGSKTVGGKTQKGDWSIEDVDNKNGNENGSGQFQFSNKPGKKAPASGGDWAIDDVDPKKPAKKTTKGDWAIEDAGSKKN